MEKLEPKLCEYCNNLFQPHLNKQQFCSISCSSKRQPKGKRHPLWKGGHHNWKRWSKRKHTRGYIEIFNGTKWIGEHRLIMSQHIGRPLETFEHVHHINGIGSDNRLENLIMLTKSQHNSLHKKEEVKGFKRTKNGQFSN